MLHILNIVAVEMMVEFIMKKTMMRPLWFVFLHITNVSETQLTFETLKGNFCNNDKLFKPINDINTNAEEYVFKFPSIQIKPKEAILFLYLCVLHLLTT